MTRDARLNWQEILQQHPQLEHLSEDAQVNINHPNCPAGQDRKKRLYIRKRNGSLIGYCHHCQSKGAKGGQRNHIRNRSPTMSHFDLKLPYDFTSKVADFHVYGRAWLRKYLHESEIMEAGIGWSAERGRVILPVHWDGKLVAFQSRRVHPTDAGPKYLTDKIRSVKHPVFLRTASPLPEYARTMVLVEDVLSSIVMNRTGPSCGLLGVHLDDTVLHALIGMGFNKFVIALDDDNHEVKRQQRAMQKKISQFADVKLITGAGKDPKEWDEQTRREAYQ